MIYNVNVYAVHTYCHGLNIFMLTSLGMSSSYGILLCVCISHIAFLLQAFDCFIIALKLTVIVIIIIINFQTL